MALVLDGDNGIVGVLATNNDGDVIFDTSTLFVDAVENKVGIGTISPGGPLEISNGSERHRVAFDTGEVYLMARNASSYITQEYIANQHVFTGYGDNSSNEAMRIDASGSVLIGSTLNDPIARATSAIEFAKEGYINVNRANNISAYFGRSGSDGDIVNFYKGTSKAGAIGRGGSGFFIAGVASTDFGVVFDGSGLLSSNDDGVLRDNQYNIGHGAYRWTNIYATNGSINTSDQTEKQDIAPLTATEMLVAKRISAMFKNYRWKDKVTTEGDSARNHTGIIAQDVQAAFTAESLDASNYGLFCSDTWWETQTEVPAVEAVAEVTDEDGNVTTEAVEAVDAYTRTDTYETEDEAPEGATSKTRLGIRYPELLSFVAAYNEQRFASIEARLTALEA